MTETEFEEAIDSASSLAVLTEIEAQINASGLPENVKERLRALIAFRRREIIKPPRGMHGNQSKISRKYHLVRSQGAMPAVASGNQSETRRK